MARLPALAAVAGPGLLAGLSDDDPAGITTYSILGADYGYRLLWVLAVSTAALILFHELGARMGCVTGQGLAGLVRERYGVRWAGVGLVCLVVANVGTTCAEFAGVAAAMELAGVSRYVSVPLAAVGVSAARPARQLPPRRTRAARAQRGVRRLHRRGVPRRARLGRGRARARRPRPSVGPRGDPHHAATVGTTLAPWGLAFIQSYAVDKGLAPSDVALERIDVVAGAVMTGVIGVFIVVACAATLHAQRPDIDDAADAARALEPLAGGLASTLFAAGLLGAALLAASILPLSTAYSVSEALGRRGPARRPLARGAARSTGPTASSWSSRPRSS